MKMFKKPWWCGIVWCVVASGCAVESAPEGEASQEGAVESVETSTSARGGVASWGSATG